MLVGVNLLREGLDLPEVSLVAILDADKEGFLRSHVSLIQTIGRAARNLQGRVIMYAERLTDSMKLALDETNRRREVQRKFNQEHGITPTAVRKNILDLSEQLYSMEGLPKALYAAEQAPELLTREETAAKTPEELEKLVVELEEEMLAAAEDLRFEEAARIRDELKELRRDLESLPA